MSFCSLTKICRLCVWVIINKRSFESFMCLDLVKFHSFINEFSHETFIQPNEFNLVSRMVFIGIVYYLL